MSLVSRFDSYLRNHGVGEKIQRLIPNSDEFFLFRLPTTNKLTLLTSVLRSPPFASRTPLPPQQSRIRPSRRSLFSTREFANGDSEDSVEGIFSPSDDVAPLQRVCCQLALLSPRQSLLDVLQGSDRDGDSDELQRTFWSDLLTLAECLQLDHRDNFGEASSMNMVKFIESLATRVDDVFARPPDSGSSGGSASDVDKAFDIEALEREIQTTKRRSMRLARELADFHRGEYRSSGAHQHDLSGLSESESDRSGEFELPPVPHPLEDEESDGFSPAEFQSLLGSLQRNYQRFELMASRFVAASTLRKLPVVGEDDESSSYVPSGDFVDACRNVHSTLSDIHRMSATLSEIRENVMNLCGFGVGPGQRKNSVVSRVSGIELLRQSLADM